MSGLPEFDQLRDNARDIKNHTLQNLDLYLEAYEEKVVESGGHVHWAADGEEARNKVLEICRNRMLNGEAIRLDGAVRLSAR